MDLVVIDCGHACLSLCAQADRLDKLQSEFRTQEQKLEDIDTARRKVAVSETYSARLGTIECSDCSMSANSVFGPLQYLPGCLVVAQFFPVGTKATECVAVRN